jgi:hypothetical protein
MILSGYDDLNVYYGDLHCHCDIGYGHGSVEDAYQNARNQLDFASVTAHAHWPDMPEEDHRLAAVVAYHREGFEHAAKLWPHLQEATEAVHQDGEFVSFPSFEWHSMRHGDHNIYFKGPASCIIRADNLEEMRTQLRRLAKQDIQSFLIPHHIGYPHGYRGINWDDFTSEFSPVVEIFSMHGLSESDDGPYPYLHTMGPRDSKSTMQHGLRMGKIFGVIGSTDHHSAHSGSHGNGRAAVWAEELTRGGLWEAIRARRTYALTGDRIVLAFVINDQLMGSILPSARERQIEVSVVGGGALDYVEVLHNNCVIQHWSAHEQQAGGVGEPVKVLLEVGWGEKDVTVDWQVELETIGGKLISVEPRFRGRDIVEPQQSDKGKHVFSVWDRPSENQISFTTQTWGNPTSRTSATQGICLEIDGDNNTHIRGRVNDHEVAMTLGDLKQGSQVGHLGGGFLAPAYCFHRATPKAKYTCHMSLLHQTKGDQRDWYYVRVCQKNGQWAWSSPIWVNAA